MYINIKRNFHNWMFHQIKTIFIPNISKSQHSKTEYIDFSNRRLKENLKPKESFN